MSAGIDQDGIGRNGMSFSIERYKEESRKLDISGVRWDDVRNHPLSKGDLFCLHYMMDIENHVALYLSHLLVTRACMDPVLTSFLSCWVYEELWHGENLSRMLNEYGVELDNMDRIAAIRSGLGVQNSVSILSTMVGSWALKDFAAIYLSIGAINELTTLTGYAALARKSNHPVLRDLLARITKDERRHFAFYYNSAREWLEGNRWAQRVDRFMLDRVWVPVGEGVKTAEEVDALALYLFDDEEGAEDLARIDEKIGKLPGLAGITLLSARVKVAKERSRKNPEWAWRLIEAESWAAQTERGALLHDSMTGRRRPEPESRGALVNAGIEEYEPV